MLRDLGYDTTIGLRQYYWKEYYRLNGSLEVDGKSMDAYPLLILVLCFWGLWVSEALNLKVKDVDFENGSFILRNTKTYHDRITPLDDKLKERFCLYRDQMNFCDE